MELGRLLKKQASIEVARDKKIEVEEAKFDRACKQINDEAELKLKKTLGQLTSATRPSKRIIRPT